MARVKVPVSVTGNGLVEGTAPAGWAMILAGGEGTRLRSLTRRIAGDDRPKQFCSILGGETLLDQTRRRIALVASPHRTLFVVTRGHEPFYAPALADVWSRLIVAQPSSRGTAPAILYALLRLAVMAPTDPVAIVPSDHYVSDDEAFMAHVRAAFAVVRARPELVVLLGITPDRPEVEYGWIEPSTALAGPWERWLWTVYGVRRFWEKPAPSLARKLEASGSLWNSFVMIGYVQAFLSLISRALPDVYQAFGSIRSVLATRVEAEAIRRLYDRLPAADFSRQVLATGSTRLAVLPVSGVGWNDLGDPQRVSTTERQALHWSNGRRPVAGLVG